MHPDLESPSKGCFSINDQFPFQDLTEMDDFTNQTNLDLIFDTYYSTRVPQYGTGIELPEDCKNMSFSELFGQELLSTEEPKDCKITIKIENDDSLDTNNSRSLINAEENISSSSFLSKTLKKGINRTLIKSSDDCDITHLLSYPFCTDDLRDNQILMKPVTKQELKVTNTIVDKDSLELKTSLCSIAADLCNTTSSPLKHQSIKEKSSKKCENLVINPLSLFKIPKIKEEPDYAGDITEQNIAEIKFTPCNPGDASQYKNDGQDFVKMEEVIFDDKKKTFLSSSSITSSNYHDVNSAYVKLTDVKDLIYNSYCTKNNVKNNQMPVETKKYKPVSTHENIVQTKQITCTGNCSHIITDCHKSIKVEVVEKDLLSSQSKGCIQKPNGKNKASVKLTKNSGTKQLVNKPFTERSLVETKTFDVNNERINFNPNRTPCFSVNKPPNTSVNRNTILSSVSSNEVPISPTNSKSSKKIIKGHKVKLINKPFDNSQNLDTSEKIAIESSLSKSSSPKSHKVNKITENNDDQKVTHKLSLKSKNQNFEQSSLKTKTIIKEEKSKVITDAIKQNTVKSDVVPFYVKDNFSKKGNCLNTKKIKKDILTALSENTPKCKGVKRTVKAVENVKQQVKKSAYKNLSNNPTKVVKSEPIDDPEVNHIVEETLTVNKNINRVSKCVVGSNDICDTVINNTNTENQEVVIVKEENKSSLKNDISFQAITADNEKKKITWEEFRAKRGKMGLLSMTDNNEDLVKDKTTDIGELESILEEFDRNTDVYFINKKRKVDDTEEQNISAAKKINKIEDLELQYKRMKIEHFQTLLPTSFGSEIAKTASSLIKGVLVEDNEIDNNSSGKTRTNSCSTQEDLVSLKHDDKFVKKNNQTRINSSRCSSSRSAHSKKNGRSMSSNPDDYYHRNRHDAAQHVGQYGKNVRKPDRRSKDQKKVVYVGQIPIRFGKPYLLNRFQKFGSIVSITLHRKPDFRVYYAFVTYSDRTEAERAINHGNDDKTQVQLDIRFGERKQTQTPYYDLDDEWLTDWYGYNNQPLAAVRPPKSPENVSFEQELQEFYKLAQIKKSNNKSS